MVALGRGGGSYERETPVTRAPSPALGQVIWDLVSPDYVSDFTQHGKELLPERALS